MFGRSYEHYVDYGPSRTILSMDWKDFSKVTVPRISKAEFERFAVYVSRVGRLTPVYMALIDPFRKPIVYPSLLRSVHAGWMRASTVRTDVRFAHFMSDSQSATNRT